MLWLFLLVLLAASNAIAQPSGGLSVIGSPSQIQIACSEDEILKFSSNAWACAADASGGGSGSILDLGDDASNESTSIGEIATTGDTNSVFTEPSADKLLINLGNNWPTADAATALSANGANCSSGNAPLGVDASGAVESCFDVEEEAHAAEHAENAADELLGENLGTACTADQLLRSDGAGGLDCDSVIPSTVEVFYQADCSTQTAIGELCVDSDNGFVYSGDGEVSNLLSTETSLTLDQSFDLGKSIDGADSQANAFDVGDGFSGYRIYVGTNGPVLECYIGSATCDILFNVQSGNTFDIKYQGSSCVQIDSNGAVVLSNNCIEYRSLFFGAGTFSTDGTNCATPVERTINSGPKLWTLNCGDAAGSIFYGNVTLPDAYNGGAITFELAAENENATPSGVLDFDFSAMCRGSGDAINSTWGTAANAAITFTTQYAEMHATTSSVTPNGTCAAGDTLYWRAVMDAAATTTQVADAYILGVKLEVPHNDWSDN